VKHLSRFLFCSLLAAASAQAMACYTVYDRSGRVLYQGEDAPVDMSLQIHEAMAARYPGGHLTFDTTARCPSLVASATRPAPVSGGTPLLTNQRTAEAMNLPYTQLAGGIALVQTGNARMAPGITVVPAESTALASARPGRNTVVTEYRDASGAIVELVDRSDPAAATRMMGAGPAPRR
jgi:hypothetical protein